MQFAYPYILLFISPVFLAGWYAIRRGVSKSLIISRMVILSLLIIALASPLTLKTTTIRDEAPRITIISDQTMSMDLFPKNTGKKIFENIKSKTPTTYAQFTGIRSPIGDEIIARASGDNNILLISDGNNNYGKNLFDSIAFVSKAGTRVFAVKQKLMHNDVSVEITGAKNIIIGNQSFNIIVRQAGNSTSYRLDVQIDGIPVISEEILQKERIKVIQFSHYFNTLGNHRITARIIPKSEDWFNINNIFYKSVFVVPKPKILMITDDLTSPLYQITTSLYDVTTMNIMPDNLSSYKAVVIDNQEITQLSAEILRDYVAEGGGLVVVGGDNSYDRGNYNNSPFEAILPIISKAGEYKGGNNVVIVIDASGSTAYKDETTGRSFIGLINANAINILHNLGRDSHVGVVAFGGGTKKMGLLPLSQSSIAQLESFIREIGPKGVDNPTDLDNGLRAAEELLSSRSGTKEIIVLSDGVMPHEGFEQIKQTVQDIARNIRIHFVQVLVSYEKTKKANKLYEELAEIVNEKVTVLNPDERASTLIEESPAPIPTPEITFEYPLIVVNSNHFITRYLNLTASVTGYNDVIPKLGGEELIATMRGKPILTTWYFGLGRVVAFTTDNGGGDTRWGSEVFHAENSRLISSMINWAIGDPRPKHGMIIQAEDTWAGSETKITVTSDTLPQLRLDGSSIDLYRVAPKRYETSVTIEKEGFHDLSGYGIAVNYPKEYRNIGFNEDLIKAIESNGGKVYSTSDEGLLLLDIKESSARKVQQPESEKELFILASLILFLGEVIIRRLKERGKERPLIQNT